MAPLWGKLLMKMTGMAYLRRGILAWEIWKQGRQEINRYAHNEAQRDNGINVFLTLDIKNDNDSNIKKYH